MPLAFAEKAGTPRALALALCTLWGNILLLDTPGSALLSAPFASRMASMAFSIVGFAAVWAFARSCAARPLRTRRGLLAVSAVLSAAGSFLHFGEFAWLPGWADVGAVAVFSVAFAFLLVACGEVYAQMGARRAVVCASMSYLLAYLGSTLVGGLGAGAVCAVETLLPLAICALVAQGAGAGMAPAADEAGAASGPAGAGASVSPASCADGAGARARAAGWRAGAAAVQAEGLRGAVAATLEAIPARVLTAIGITYFAIGSTLAQAGTPLDYFSWGTALAAVLTSVVVMGAAILLHGRVTLTSLYKVLMVGQVLAAFLLSEWAEGAQVAIVITFVGVKIVAWTLMAELALLSQARGGAGPALVYAAGCLAGHIGEGVAGVISVFGLVDQGPLTIVVVALLVGAAAFLFTGEMGKYPDISDACGADEDGVPFADAGRDGAGMLADSSGGARGGSASRVASGAGGGPGGLRMQGAGGLAPRLAPGAAGCGVGGLRTQGSSGFAAQTSGASASRRATVSSLSGVDSLASSTASQGSAPADAADASPAAGLDARINELAGAYLLSARETEVFRLWATGHTLKYIQEKLYLSPSTVKTHVRHIYDKTGKHSRAEIVELLDPLADTQEGR